MKRSGNLKYGNLSKLMQSCQMVTPPRSLKISKKKWAKLKAGEKSMIAKRLKLDVVWGRMPAYIAQQYAADAIADGARPTLDLKRLSKLGCEGKHPSGCWADFCKNLDSSFVESIMTRIPIPLKRKKKRGYLLVALPHKFFSAIYHESKKEFDSIMYGSDTNNLTRFWDSQHDHPSFRDHCMHHHPYKNFREFAIPFGLHGDEVATVGCGRSWSKLSHCISIASLVGVGPTARRRLIHFLIYSCICAGSYGQETLDEVSRWFVWSLNCLYDGVWPFRDANEKEYTYGVDKDRAGTYLADGFYGIWWATQVDLDYMQKAWKGAKYNTSAEPCNSCACNSTTNPWADCRVKVAGWLKTCWTRLTYAAKHPERHVLFRDVPSGGILTYIPDVLHVKHLGTDQSYYASVVHLLTHYHMPGDPDENLNVIFKMSCEEYKKRGLPHNDRLPVLYPNMVKQSKAKLPLLKGKAAKVKVFGSVLLGVFEELMDSLDPRHQLILKGLRLSVRIDDIMHKYTEAHRYPKPVAEEFEQACFTYCRVMCALIRAYHKAVPAIPVFNYTIKAHYLMHLGVCARYTNPVYGSCYDGETLMLTGKKLFQASCRGNGPLAASNQAMCFANEGSI